MPSVSATGCHRLGAVTGQDMQIEAEIAQRLRGFHGIGTQTLRDGENTRNAGRA